MTEAVYFVESETQIVNTLAVSQEDAKTMRLAAAKIEGVELSFVLQRKAIKGYMAAAEARCKNDEAGVIGVDAEIVRQGIGRMLKARGRVVRVTADSPEGQAKQLMKKFDDQCRKISSEKNARLVNDLLKAPMGSLVYYRR